MLQDTNFVQESVSINLYYLRTLSEFCLNVETSLIPFEQAYINEAKNIGNSCENLGRQLINIANGVVSQSALNYQIYVTPYTLECEKLTEKLFNKKLATDITETELKLTAGKLTTVSPAVLSQVESINNEALNLAQRFIDLCNEIYTRMTTNDLFSYSYLTMFEFMIFDTELFKSGLNRIIQRTILNPSSVANYEFYFNNSMRSIATFINKLVDPQNQQIIDRSNIFIGAFADTARLYQNTPLNPEYQIELTNRQIVIVKEFHDFIELCIEELLNKRAYFIIEPIFLDNMLRQVNFLQYVLNYIKLNQ